MKKKQANKLAKKFRLAYFSSRYWLEYLCEHKKKNGERLAYIKNINGDGLILQYPPKRLSNLENIEINLATSDEVAFIKDKVEIQEQDKMMSEYFFKTQDIVALAGPQHKKNRQAISIFERMYNCEVVYDYDKKKVKEFLKKWDEGQKLKTAPYKRGLDFCHFVLDRLGDKNLKAVYALIDGKLVGVSIGELLNKKQWIALHQKVDYRYRGLGRWLFRERAKLFTGTEEFANGGAMGDEGIVKFKESLRPYKVEPYYYLKLGKLK